jgi:SpoVK/Ycf46/Vps4 family AAA+-type ATPase
LIETDRSDIVEKYVGHTSKKMLELVESAKGGILFIDEAYALAKDDNDKDFGKEAIDTLVKMMEDNREDLVVIVAGYPMEMEKFLSSNSGLKSRFPYNIHFEDYSNDELSIVFKRLCESKGYFVSESVLQKVEKLIDTTKKADELTFGNARGVRNIFERIEINQMSRLAKLTEISNEDLQTFLEIDIV